MENKSQHGHSSQQKALRVSSKLQAKVGIVALVSVLLVGCTDNKSSHDTIDQTALVISRAQSYHNKGQYRASIIEAKNALKRAPQNITARLLVAENYIVLGDFKSAIQSLKEMPEEGIKPTTNYYLTLANAHSKQRKFLSAIRAIDNIKGNLSKRQALEKAIILSKSYSGIGQFDKSATWLDKAREIDAQDARIIENEIITAFRMNKMQLATTLVQDALAHTSENPDILAWAGNLAKFQGDLEGATQYYTEALANIPNTDIITAQKFRILTQLIDTFTKLGRAEESYLYSKILSDAFPGQQDIKSKYQEAMEAIRTSQLDDAEKTLRQLLEESGGAHEIGALLGIVKYQKGDYKSATNLLNKYIDPEIASDNTVHMLLSSNWKSDQKNAILDLLDGQLLEKYSNNAKIQAIYGIAALSLNREAAGVAALIKAMQLEPLNTVYPITIATHYNRKTQHDNAIDILQKALLHAPNSETINASLIESLLAANKLQEATRRADKLMQQLPNSTLIQAVNAKLLLQKGQLASAQALLEKLISEDNTNAQAYLGLAEIAVANKRWNVAEKYYQDVIRLAPLHPSGYKGLLSIYDKKGDRQAGVDLLVQLSKAEKNTFAANIILVEFHLLTQQYDKALDFVKKALKAQPLSIKAKRLQAAIYIQSSHQFLANQDTKKAKDTLLQARAEGITDLSILNLYTSILIENGELKKAARSIQEIAEIYPNSPVIYMLEGELYAKQQAFPDAVAAFKRAWQTTASPQLAQRILFLLQKHISQAEAIAFATQWQEREPNNPQPLFQQGVLYQQQGQHEQAKTLYRATIALVPDHIDALNNLAWIYFEEKNSKAKSLAARAFAKAPNNANIADTYGWILANSGEKEKGQKILEKALSLDPNNKDIKQRLESITQ